MPTYKKINFIKTLNFRERSTLYQMFFSDSTSKRGKTDKQRMSTTIRTFFHSFQLLTDEIFIRCRKLKKGPSLNDYDQGLFQVVMVLRV